jgi:DNA-binding NarL/FixJ family response regulator
MMHLLRNPKTVTGKTSPQVSSREKSRKADMERKLKVLLAEDEKITALDLKLGLRHFGYNVIKVVDKGVDLITEALNSDPDVIVSDINLKDDISGIQAVNKILLKKKIPVVIISGFNDEKTLSAVKKLKPCAFLNKPCNARDINKIIMNCMY